MHINFNLCIEFFFLPFFPLLQCLSHLEDGLLTLNEKGKLLADTLSQSGSPDLGDELLASVQESLR